MPHQRAAVDWMDCKECWFSTVHSPLERMVSICRVWLQHSSNLTDSLCQLNTASYIFQLVFLVCWESLPIQNSREPELAINSPPISKQRVQDFCMKLIHSFSAKHKILLISCGIRMGRSMDMKLNQHNLPNQCQLWPHA